MNIEIIPESIQLLKLTDEEYFSEKYKDYISNSKLGLINTEEGGSVDKFVSGFKKEYVPAFEIGTAIHSMILQPDYFEIPDITKPNGKLGAFAESVYNFRSKNNSIQKSVELASDFIGYYSGKLSEKRLKTAIKESLDFYLKRIKFIGSLKTPLFLSNSHYDIFQKCMASVTSSGFNKILTPEGLLIAPEVYNEYAILAEVKIGNKIIKVKAKLDNFTIDEETNTLTLNDLKTTGKPSNYFMGNYIHSEGNKIWIDGSFQKYRYYRQIAMYMWLLQAAIKVTKGIVYNTKANILVIETIPPFGTRVCKISNNSVKAGIDEFKKLLILAANEC